MCDMSDICMLSTFDILKLSRKNITSKDKLSTELQMKKTC